MAENENPLAVFVLNCARLAREAAERGDWDAMTKHLEAGTKAMRDTRTQTERTDARRQ